jgi:uncharacterized protein YijF (DUF1287 family)
MFVRREMMNRVMKSVAALAFSVAAMLAVVGSAGATVFAAWEVANVPWGDTLNVRKYPASYSQKQSAYPNGTVLQMTGRCTGGVDLHAIMGQPAWKQRQAVRTKWCEVWHDPKRNGKFATGWVYGKYIQPH